MFVGVIRLESMKKIFIIVLFLCQLISCELFYKSLIVSHCSGPSLRVKPNNLSEGRVGEVYLIQLIIENSRVAVKDIRIKGAMAKGLELLHEKESNLIRIQGVPELAGEYEFTLTVSTYGTQCVGQVVEQSFRHIIKLATPKTKI